MDSFQNPHDIDSSSIVVDASLTLTVEGATNNASPVVGGIVVVVVAAAAAAASSVMSEVSGVYPRYVATTVQATSTLNPSWQAIIGNDWKKGQESP